MLRALQDAPLTEETYCYDVAGNGDGPPEMDLALPEPPGEFTATGYYLRPGLSFDEWQAAGLSLRTMYRSTLLYLGDWLLYGEANYGEDWSQAVDGYDERTLANAMSVCRRFPPSQRRVSEHLAFGHYQALTSLPDAAAGPLLETADAEQWSVAKVRREAAAARNGETHDVVKPPSPHCATCACYAAPPARGGGSEREG